MLLLSSYSIVRFPSSCVSCPAPSVSSPVVPSVSASGIISSGASPSGCPLSGISLSGASPSGSTFSGISLSGTSPSGSTFSGSSLSGASPSGSTFSGSSLSGCPLPGIWLSGCPLSGSPDNSPSSCTSGEKFSPVSSDSVSVKTSDSADTYREGKEKTEAITSRTRIIEEIILFHRLDFCFIFCYPFSISCVSFFCLFLFLITFFIVFYRPPSCPKPFIINNRQMNYKNLCS
ncbi:MAG: pentapeptide repeat-containing protein [Clostridiales bacterium]|nr:pentapeptide repeat-containing protein [Clostridiales bacterium]